MVKKTKKVRHSNINSYYIKGQAQKEKSNIEKKKAKDREKRIKQNKKMQEDDFDIETEEVIQMTNKNKIKKDIEARRRIEKQENKKKSRNKKIKLVLKITLLLIIIAGSITFAMVSPIFDIKSIEVINNKKISTETIISLSKLKQNENIFRFISSNVEKNIKENAYIEKAKIHRKFPDKIQIEIEERKHSFSVDFLGQYAYINTQGYILEISSDSAQKTIIQGITTKEEDVVAGKRLCEDDLEKLEDAIKIMHSAKEYNLDTKVTSIDISNKNDYSMYLQEENKKVYLGDNSNLSNKILYVNAILEQEKGKAGEIFANGDLNNKFRVYFRENLNI